MDGANHWAAVTILLHAAVAGGRSPSQLGFGQMRARDTIAHNYADLPLSHPHLREYAGHRGHAHVFVIDVLHRRWPS
jgi:hypothetical protein